MYKIRFAVVISAFFLLQNCQPAALIKKKATPAPSDSVLFYQQRDVPDPFLDSLQTHPGDSALLKTVLLPPPPPLRPYREVDGFRVQIFAGMDSMRAAAQLVSAQSLTTDSLYLIKDNGLFKVQVGDYLYRMSADSANRYFHVKGYKGAWVVKRKIHLLKNEVSPSAGVKPSSSDSTNALQQNSDGKITIQVLATGDEARALQLIRQLQNSFSSPSYYRKSGDLYKIFLGKYKTRKEAEKALKHVRQNGFPDAWLVY